MFAATLFSIPSYCGDWSLVWVVYSRHWDVFPQFADQFNQTARPLRIGTKFDDQTVIRIGKRCELPILNFWPAA